MFNKVILVGNLTRDIELRSAGGFMIGSTGIAVTRKYKNGNGENVEDTLFIDITFFGKLSEVANQYLKKGSKLLIEGRLKLDTWQDQQGNTRSKHSVIVENMEMLDNKNTIINNSGNIASGNQVINTKPNYNQTQNNEKYEYVNNDTIPF
ncbi:single-stranded DNA-binding protein [Campylobacter hyointestinalis subsp. hyointestinalis]|uniref:Single-stranded DNA-binding protein n=1 Tax=Campylobacter hyointestinalis subsp. hyointestinalis TaxID=91352 RepID=A0A0S4R207_CAMHY|nr:single-stranded DNA-binding protein [Campylobacter hyointestinalis]CUU67737.1 single-stranded DNA-binding protein [Campylobacter hyointestinalis subsp. hyointestinalis]CUU81561.1 single-stranded DNA-binding protein [Campylobacter hyointestinalis subsp. hyointestinalis]